MPAKRRKRKAEVVEDLPNPGERQLCRLPDWWGAADPVELEKAHERARQLIAGEPISWNELIGRQ